MELLLGLDVGTTWVKGLVCDASGRKHSFASHPVSLQKGQPNRVEQNADELWQAVGVVCRKITGQIPAGDRVCALSLSTQGGTTIPVDGRGSPTNMAFSWMDERGVGEAESARRVFGGESIYLTTGWPLFAGLPLIHIAWFRKNCPDAYARTRRFMFVNDFILEKFSGKFCMDPSNAGITQLCDVVKNTWDEDLARFAGAAVDQLSPIFPSGAVVGCLTAEAASFTGLAAGTTIVNGAHDQYCAALGTGVTHPGEVLLSCGTAWVVLVVPPDPRQAFQGGLCVSRHAVPGLWGGIRSMGGVGASVEWLLDQFWPEIAQPSSRYEALNRSVASSPPGAKGLIFTPLSGGHLETGELANRGLLGLSLDHSRSDISRAVLEGIGLELNWMLDEIRQSASVTRLKMIGGASRSPVWPQIVADVTQIPVDLPSEPEAASLGAAILAGVGAGWYPDPVSAYAHFHIPQKKVPPQTTSMEWSSQLNQRYRQTWAFLPHHTENRLVGISL